MYSKDAAWAVHSQNGTTWWKLQESAGLEQCKIGYKLWGNLLSKQNDFWGQSVYFQKSCLFVLCISLAVPELKIFLPWVAGVFILLLPSLSFPWNYIFLMKISCMTYSKAFYNRSSKRWTETGWTFSYPYTRFCTVKSVSSFLSLVWKTIYVFHLALYIFFYDVPRDEINKS